jgi:hypothetical protein
VSVEGKTLEGKKRTHSPPTTGENVNAILWGRKNSIHRHQLLGKDENTFAHPLLGKDENAFTKPFTAESIHFSPSIAMELTWTENAIKPLF